MGKGKQKALTFQSINERNSLLYWLVIAFVVLFIFISPFYKGLFNGGTLQFEGPIYRATLWSSVGLFIVSIYLFINKQQREHRDLLTLIVWLIPLSFLVSVSNAASYHLAMNSVYIYVMYAIFFIIGLYFTRNRMGLTFITYTIVVSGYVLVIFGLMNWFGNANYPEAVLGSRMAGVFQYPNTYATFLIGMIFSSMLLTTVSKKWYLISFHSLMFVPILLSFLLTLSRGGLLVFPIVLIIFLLFLPLHKQILTLIYLSISVLVTFLILNRITNIRLQLNDGYTNALSINGWIILVSVTLGVCVFVLSTHKYISFWLEKKFDGQKTFRLKNCLIPIGLVIISLLAMIALLGGSFITDKMPLAIKQRVESINLQDDSLLSRTVYLKDSVGIMKDYPVLGAGGGAWASLYQVYQSYPYTSTQAHFYFFQHILEVGWLGFSIFIIFLIYLLTTFVRYFVLNNSKDFQYERIVFVMFICSILIHGAIDFDISFVYIGVLLFLCLGGMSSPIRVGVNKFTSFMEVRSYKLIPTLLCVISILIFAASIMGVTGNSSFISAVNDKSGNYNEISKKVDKAIKYQPNNPSYILAKVDLLTHVYEQTKDEKYFEESIKKLNHLEQKESFNRQAYDKEYSLLVAKGDLDKAAILLSSQINMFPWAIDIYENMIDLQFELGKRAREEGFKENSDEYWDKALNLYSDMIEKRKRLDNLSEYQRNEGYKFRVTPKMALAISKIYFMRTDYKLASNVLINQVSLNLNLEINKEIARWYIASVQKQNINDEKLYKLLIEVDESEANKIDELVNSNH